MSRLERRRRRARRPCAPSTTRRPARAPHRAAHRGGPLLVADQRYPGGRDAGVRRTIHRGAALGSDQFPAGAVGRVRRARYGAYRRARPPLARRARFHVRGGTDATARPQGVSRACRVARALSPARRASAHEPARRARRHPRRPRRRGDRGSDRRRSRRDSPSWRRAARAVPNRDGGRRRHRDRVPAIRRLAPRGVPHRPSGLHPRHRAEPRRSGGARDAPRPDPGAQPGENTRRGAARGARALMRAWKVVVLINLALIVGGGWGYAVWGLRAARLERELAGARAAALAGVERGWVLAGAASGRCPGVNVLLTTPMATPGYIPPMATCVVAHP